jgi:hypothetical protein
MYCWLAQVWAHLSCLQEQMEQHPRHFHYNFQRYICDLCQHELRVQAAQVGSRNGTSLPPFAQRKVTPTSTFAISPGIWRMELQMRAFNSALLLHSMAFLYPGSTMQMSFWSRAHQ